MTSPTRSLLIVFAAVSAATSMVGPDLLAQESRGGGEIWGRIHQAGDTLSLPGALVEAVGTGVSSAASRAGLYRMVRLRSGPHVVRVRLLGYRSVTLEVDLQDSQSAHRDIPLERLSVTLPEVRIEGQLRRVPSRFEDVYRRMTTANGKFFTREDIELLSPPDVQGLLMRVPTVRVNVHGIQFAKCDVGGAYALVRGGGRANTGVQIYIDGYRVTGRSAPIERSGVSEAVNSAKCSAG